MTSAPASRSDRETASDGAPLIVVGRALGYADTRMFDQHYAHLAPSYLADTIRSTAPNLTLQERSLRKLDWQIAECVTKASATSSS